MPLPYGPSDVSPNVNIHNITPQGPGFWRGTALPILGGIGASMLTGNPLVGRYVGQGLSSGDWSFGNMFNNPLSGLGSSVGNAFSGARDWLSNLFSSPNPFTGAGSLAYSPQPTGSQENPNYNPSNNLGWIGAALNPGPAMTNQQATRLLYSNPAIGGMARLTNPAGMQHDRGSGGSYWDQGGMLGGGFAAQQQTPTGPRGEIYML